MFFHDFSRKNDENQGNRRKMKETKENIYFYEKILKNEKCAAFRAGSAGPVGKNMIF